MFILEYMCLTVCASRFMKVSVGIRVTCKDERGSMQSRTIMLLFVYEYSCLLCNTVCRFYIFAPFWFRCMLMGNLCCVVEKIVNKKKTTTTNDLKLRNTAVVICTEKKWMYLSYFLRVWLVHYMYMHGCLDVIESCLMYVELSMCCCCLW
jgi:hypothetical protein